MPSRRQKRTTHVRRRYRPVGGFTPPALSGLVGWFDASAITGLSDGGTVATWSDLSVSANHLAQATESVKPTYQTNELNGRPVVRLDGTDDKMAAAGSVAFKHVLVVAKFSAATFPNYSGLITGTGAGGEQIVLIGDGFDGTRTILHDDATQTTVYYRGGTLGAEASMPGPMEAFHVMSLSQAAGWSITTQLGQDRANAARFWNGDVAEILLYDSVLSTPNLNRAAGWLAKKWGLTWTQVV
jgi:hypothetical protein